MTSFGNNGNNVLVLVLPVSLVSLFRTNKISSEISTPSTPSHNPMKQEFFKGQKKKKKNLATPLVKLSNSYYSFPV